MKHKPFFALVLSLALLAGCGARGEVSPSPVPPETIGPVDGPPWFASYRIVSGAETGELILAAYEGTRGEVYTLSTQNLELAEPLENGQVVNVYYEAIMESYPAQFSGVSKVEQTEVEQDDRCGLYLQVLEDLWEVDSGLNGGVTQLGIDLSEVTDLAESEKSALAYAFGMKHGVMPLEATWEELVEDGYITGEPLGEGSDAQFYEWEDGLLFSITGSAEEGFEAQKWRSGLGAYFFTDCTAKEKDGSWTYEVGAEAIS